MLPTMASACEASRATNKALVGEEMISSRAQRSGPTAVVDSCGSSRAMTSTSSSVTVRTRSILRSSLPMG
jgi:hypothetical protein